MRTISYKLDDLKKIVIPIGFEGENDHTRVIIDAGEVFAQYPSAAASLRVKPPQGSIYPVVVNRDGDRVIWNVKDTDCASDGNGEAQFTFTENNVIVKSVVTKIKINRSLVATGPAPDPIEDWLDEATEVLDDLSAMDNIAKNAQASDIGKSLSPKTVVDGVVTEWQYVEQSGGTEDYTDLENKPSIAGVTLSGNKTLEDLGIAADDDLDNLADEVSDVKSEIQGAKISSFGVKETDDGENYQKFIDALNSGKQIIIDVDFEIDVTDTITSKEISKDIDLIGYGDKTITLKGTISGNYHSLLVPAAGLDNITINGVKISSECSKRVIFINGTDYRLWKMNTVNVENCTIKGVIVLLYMRGSYTAAPETFGLDHLSINNNIFTDVHEHCFFLNTVRVETTDVRNNTIKNLGGTFLYLEVSNSTTDREAMKLSRKVVNVDGNTVQNDIGYWFDNATLNATYFAFVYAQCDTLNYTNNRVEGLKTIDRIATYDVYGAANYLFYANNMWVNNIAFNTSALNSLVKGKSGGNELYVNSIFRVDESFIALCGKTDEDTNLTFVHFEHTDGSVEISGCTFEAPCVKHTSQHATWYYTKLNFHDNNVHFGKWTNYYLFNLPETCKNVYFNNNIIRIDQFDGGMGILNGYGVGRYEVEIIGNDIVINSETDASRNMFINLRGKLLRMNDNRIKVIVGDMLTTTTKLWYMLNECVFDSIEIDGNNIESNATMIAYNTAINNIKYLSSRFVVNKNTKEIPQRLFINADYSIFDRTYILKATAYTANGLEKYEAVVRLMSADGAFKMRYTNASGTVVEQDISVSGTRTIKNFADGTSYTITQFTPANGSTPYFKITPSSSLDDENRTIEITIEAIENTDGTGMLFSGNIYDQKIPDWCENIALKEIGGKTIFANQLSPKSNINTTKAKAVSGHNESIRVTATQSSADYVLLHETGNTFSVYEGHKYYIKGNPGGTEGVRLSTTAGANINQSDEGQGKIITYSSDSNTARMQIRLPVGTFDFVITPQLYDLTLMFGSGNEPTTVAEIEAILADKYYEPSTGTPINAGVNIVELHSKNMIDTESMCGMDGSNAYAAVPVEGGETYKISSVSIGTEIEIVDDALYEYDSNDTLLKTTTFTYDDDGNPAAFTCEKTTAYIRFEISGTGVDDKYSFKMFKVMMEHGAKATNYTDYHAPIIKELPVEVLELDSYGVGISASSRNYIDFDTMKYHKYYEVDGLSVVPVTHTQTDVSEMMEGFDHVFDPDGRNIIIFKSVADDDGYKVPVPVKIKYET